MAGYGVLALLGVATWHDVRTREIPDWISVAILAIAVLDVASGGRANSWGGALVGLLLGLLLSAPLFYLGGLGGADVKLAAALGAFLGPARLLVMLFGVAVVGGVLAAIAKWRGRDDFAYGPAIWAGFAWVFLSQEWSTDG